MRFGTYVAKDEKPNTIKRCIESAVRAEKLGYDSIVMGDSVNGPDTYMILAQIAAATTKLMIGSGLTNPFVRHPVLVAGLAASLCEIAPGRARMGIVRGPAGRPGDVLGLRIQKPITGVVEAIKIIKELLSTGKIDFTGQVFPKVEYELGLSAPVDIKVVVTTSGPKMARAVGEVADGIMSPIGTKKYEENLLAKFREGQRAVGLEGRPHEFIRMLPVIISDDEDESLKLAKPAVARFIANRPPAVQVMMELEPSMIAGIKEAGNDNEKLIELIPDWLARELSICGTTETALQSIYELEAKGVTELILFRSTESILQTFSEKILPAF